MHSWKGAAFPPFCSNQPFAAVHSRRTSAMHRFSVCDFGKNHLFSRITIAENLYILRQLMSLAEHRKWNHRCLSGLCSSSSGSVSSACSIGWISRVAEKSDHTKPNCHNHGFLGRASLTETTNVTNQTAELVFQINTNDLHWKTNRGSTLLAGYISRFYRATF